MSSSDSELEDVASHSASLKRLKAKDPDFYEFLKTNDEKLLNFQDSDAEDVSEKEEDVEMVDDDESEMLTLSQVKKLKEKIQSPTPQVVKELMTAFHCVVNQLHECSGNLQHSDTFNDIIKLCLVELIPLLNVVLNIPKAEKGNKVFDVAKSRAWKKLATCTKGYLSDILRLFSTMTEPSNCILVLKHVVHLTRYFVKSAKLSRQLLKKMISLWSSKEESVRVHALVVLYRMAKVLDKDYVAYISKHMYFSYVNNTKFTSLTSWPAINFMKNSLVEMYALNLGNAYESAFVYIRQLSIHLRNATTTKKKEAFKVVHNWQYVHCIMLWAKLLGINHDNEFLRSLIYPLVQTTIGTINLIPTPKHFPLRFHLVRTLMKLSEESKVFIPLLPIILEPLGIVNFDKKLGFSKKPIDFTCCLKLSKSQLQESGFKDGTIDQVCELLLEYFKMYSHNIGFPELALPSVVQLKAFTKKCKVAKYCQLIKQVVDKVSENSSFITEKRKSVSFKLTDDKQIEQWEANILSQGTPLTKYLKPKEKVGQPRKRQKVSHKNEQDEVMA